MTYKYSTKYRAEIYMARAFQALIYANEQLGIMEHERASVPKKLRTAVTAAIKAVPQQETTE